MVLVDEVGAYYYDASSDMAHNKTGKWHMVFPKMIVCQRRVKGLRTSCIQIRDDKNLLYLYDEKYFTHLRIWKMKRAQMRRRLK